MMKSYKLNILISFIIVFCSSCEDYYNKRVVFTIQGIIADRKVVGQGESVNISASVSIQGAVNQNNVNYAWDCTAGEFNDRANQATIWTAPSDNTGEFLISLKVSFMGNTEEGEIAIKVVRTPAGNWGSISGNIFNYIKAPVQNIIVTTKTGESDTTDTDGFFYIEDIPQGGTGLEFSNIEFKWVTEPLGRIIVSGGTHDHLGDIILYPSEPPVILDYNENPGHQSLVSIKHDLPNLFEYFELYISYDPGGGGYRLLTTIAPGTTSITIKEDRDSAYIALKSIPNQGVSSDFSPWTRIYFTEVIDPDADRSSVEYNSFFSASITWELTGYEEYYKGFRVAEENDTGFVFISPLLSASAFQYTIETKPGMTGNYYVIAFTKSDTYNKIQPPGQIISLEVPSMEHPAGFKGSLQTVGDTPVKLSWEPISANTAWYSGYIIKKKTITETTESRWEELSLITSTFTGTITDVSVNYGNIYRYSIQTLSYPPGLGIPAYSEPDSITVEDLWEQTPFNDIIDPDAEMSFFRYNNFYIASLNWQPTGYEKYYKGFKVAREGEFSELSFVSPLLAVNTYNFEIKTSPGMTGNYYVIAFTKSDTYNKIQLPEQRITLEVPSMESPAGFKGTLQTVGDTPVKLSWEPISANSTWYSGYVIKKKTITETTESGWEELSLITSTFTGTFTDVSVNFGNIYRYSIQTLSYPPEPGIPAYSEPDSITVEDLWEQTPFNDIIDPDAEMSFFRYNNFYIASLNWQPTGYEKYYKGFKVAREDEFSELSFVSPLLSVNTYNFEIKTSPGMTGDYYVIAITTTGSYNTIQPEEQKVRLEVPSMEFPSGFKGKSGTAGGINIKLSWEPIATDNTWYSGYLIEKKTITDTLEYEWEDLARIGNSFTESYTDSEIDSANVYKYSIRTISYPPGLGNPGYSLPDSIIVEPF